jgi:hypothetical protein
VVRFRSLAVAGVGSTTYPTLVAVGAETTQDVYNQFSTDVSATCGEITPALEAAP